MRVSASIMCSSVGLVILSLKGSTRGPKGIQELHSMIASRPAEPLRNKIVSASRNNFDSKCIFKFYNFSCQRYFLDKIPFVFLLSHSRGLAPLPVRI